MHRITEDGQVDVCFIDLDLGGSEGTVHYPPYLNPKAAKWPVDGDPVGQLILQAHDTRLLQSTLDAVER